MWPSKASDVIFHFMKNNLRLHDISIHIHFRQNRFLIRDANQINTQEGQTKKEVEYKHVGSIYAVIEENYPLPNYFKSFIWFDLIMREKWKYKRRNLLKCVRNKIITISHAFSNSKYKIYIIIQNNKRIWIKKDR